MKTVFDDRDLTKLLRFPTLSWSSFNAFTCYDKEKWYRQYVLGEKSQMNAEMQGGVDVGKRIVNDPTFLPSIPRGGIFEQEFKGRLGKIDLMGHLDQYWPGEGIDEFKTTSNPNRWTQDAVDEWDQITMYCLLVWLNEKIKPEDLRLRLFSIPMHDHGNFQVKQFGEPTMFETKRTMVQVLVFGAMLKTIHRQMQEFVAGKQDLR